MEDIIIKLKTMNRWLLYKISSASKLRTGTEEFIMLLENNYDSIASEIASVNFKNDFNDFNYLLSKLKTDNFTDEELRRYQSLTYSVPLLSEYKRKRKLIASRRSEILMIMTRAFKNREMKSSNSNTQQAPHGG